MQEKKGFIGYDWFKLIVAIILILLLLWLWLFGGQKANTADEMHTVNIPIVAEQVENTAAPTATLVPTATQVPTEVPTAEPTQEPTPEPTAAPTEAPTPEPTAEPTEDAEDSEAEEVSSDAGCPEAADTRLALGDMAKVMSNLNMRSAPELSNNIVQTNMAGTVLEIIGGPVCMPYQVGGYLWWEVMLDSGLSGWSAEAGADGSFYFLAPVE